MEILFILGIILILINLSGAILILIGGKELNNKKIFFAGILWTVSFSFSLILLGGTFINEIEKNTQGQSLIKSAARPNAN